MRSLAVVIATAVMIAATPGRAAVPLCVEVETDSDDAVGFEKLVLEQVAHHPTHEIVESGCETTLHVDLFIVEGVRHLTLHTEGQIPVRYEVDDDDDISRRLEEGLALVFGNDPVYLFENPASLEGMQKAMHSVLVLGHDVWRLEVFQSMARSGLAPVFAPGAAFAYTRGSGHWYVLARIHLAGWPGGLHDGDRVLRVHTGMNVGFTWEASASSPTSFYMGFTVGLVYQRWEGWVEVSGEQEKQFVNRFGVDATLRVGVRFLRTHSFDWDVFLAGTLPFFATKQTDVHLFGNRGIYTPSIVLGMGVGF